MRNVLCEYCRSNRAVHMDHIASKSERRSLPDEWATVTVPSCFDCNILKGTRRLVPPGYERLEELLGYGKKWEEWDGSEEMLKEIGTLR